jgi:GMP synthase (glutamine-hydrolysing)
MTAPGHHQRLLIVDFGSQVTQLIARRLRESSIYCEIHPFNGVTPAFLEAFRPRAVILSGGPASVTEPGSPRAPDAVFALGVPVLGICYGQQAMMVQLGGAVEGGHHREFGRAYVSPVDHAGHPIFEGLFAEGREEVWMSHGDRVTALAPGFEVFGASPGAPCAMVGDPSRDFYAVQFHPEVHHTPNGARLLRQLHPHRRLHRRLDDGRLPRRSDREDPRRGRHRAGDLRPLRRR